ncbi:MAG: anti-sigma factor antagonist [Bacteroidetes bacterium HGW-Bacteroidetes-1]|jgi:anti-anti-sigma factor|nr:MAG: anti-sigma factor antagonist [Bacteroidetes bacterium HGW-Bacteroidetes-1]
MNVQITNSENYTIIKVQGRIDTITATDFEAKVMTTLEQSKKLVINCSELDYISSSGLRVFLLTQKKINAAGGTLKLCCLQPTIKEIFDISGFSTIFSIYSDQESATNP